MNIRTFIILILTLAVLGGLVVLNKRSEQAKLAAPPPSAERLLPPERLNDIARFTVSVATETVIVARAHDRWVVESLWNYPANFEVVADNLRKLADVKCGEIIVNGMDRLEEFGLAPLTNSAVLAPANLAFYDAEGKELRKIGMGVPRMPKPTGGRPSFPESAYVLLNDREVRLVAAYMPGLPRSNDGWIDRSVLAVPAEDIDEVHVTLTNGASYGIIRKVDGTFSPDSLQDNETINQDGATALAGSLNQINLSSVVDPATPAEISGLDTPATFQAKTRDGLVYTVKIGNAAPERFGRYARIDVAYEKPAPPPSPEAPIVTDTNAPVVDLVKAWEEKSTADAARADAESKRLSPWTFILLESDCRTMASPRDQVITAVTNAPAVSATETNSPAP